MNKESHISTEEKAFITDHKTKSAPYQAIGFLITLRSREITLEEVYDEAILDPDKDQHPLYLKARNFLAEHQDVFNIDLKPQSTPTQA